MGEAASLDQILENYVGGAGKYQVINTIIMAFVYYAGLYSVFITNFVAYAPPHRDVTKMHKQRLNSSENFCKPYQISA